MRSSNDIATRAAVGFALVAGITAVAIVASALLSRHAAESRDRILSRYADDVANAARVQAATERMVAAGRGYLLTDDAGLRRRLEAARTELDVVLGALDRDDATPTERDLQEFVRRNATRYADRLDELVRTTSAEEDRKSLARTLLEDLMPLREDLDNSVEELLIHKRHLKEQAHDQTARLAERTVWTIVWLGVASLSLSIVLAWRFTRRLAAIYRLERESSERAAAALSGKQDLLNIVAHDLRSPLSSIVLRADVLARYHEEEDIRQSAEAIRATCGRMADLIESLVQAANIEAGNFAIAVRRFRVEDMVSDVVDTFAPAARQAGVSLHHSIEPPDLEINADRARLLQVLSNLVGNALKFTPSGGLAAISASATADTVTFEVRDSGRGIAAEDLPHVFERYWKHDKDASRGAGLGLYIAKGLVEAHGGHIAVETSPGRGSCFRIELPAAPEHLVSSGQGAARTKGGGPLAEGRREPRHLGFRPIRRRPALRER